MTVTKCDRCGKEIQNPNDLFLVQVENRGYQMTCRPDQFDLCEDCKETLLAWLNPHRPR